MTENKTSPQRKKRLINKKNRSAWAISIVLISLMALRLVAGIARPRANRGAVAIATVIASPVLSESDRAESAMQTFFELLAEKRFAEAVTYYGGRYDAMAAAYPQDATDETQLLQDVCEHALCLPIHSVADVRAVGADKYAFTVTFAGADGRLFTQSTIDGGQASQFSISVARLNGRYLVQELPVNP